MTTSSRLRGLDSVLARLESAWLPELDGETDQVRFCHYSALGLELFLPGLEAAEQAAPGKRFLDVGCGLGSNLLLAQAAGCQATGLEVRPEYAAAARRLCAERVEIIEADALTWSGYGGFDIVYSFQILSQPRELLQLERRIMKWMQPGALLWLPYRDTPAVAGWPEVAAHLWRCP